MTDSDTSHVVVHTTDKRLKALSQGIRLETIATRLSELEDAWTRKNDASESYADAIKHVAEAAKIEPGALKAYINAKMRDKLEKLERESEQLSFMLDELP